MMIVKAVSLGKDKIGTYQSCAMNTKGWFEVGLLMKVVFKTIPQSMAVSSDKICLHFRFTDHTIPRNTNRRLCFTQGNTVECAG